jgi:F-type H+-transporting ATPase subunit gamma
VASIRDLRTRTKSVGSIKQITRAMEMVAATKLRRFQGRAVTSRPYLDEIVALLQSLAGTLGERLEQHPLFRRGGPDKPVGVALVSSDRGLCGAYNSNVLRELELWLAERDETRVEFYVFGRKGYQYLHKRGLKIGRLIVDPPLEKVDFRSAKLMARALLRGGEQGPRFDEIWLLYTAFDSPVRFVPTWTRLVPIELPAGQTPGDVLVEPSLQDMTERLLPRYLEARVYNALLESITSEYAMRRISMKNATDAATEMQDILRKQYNRKRQESITKELLDIVGGAEVLR